MKRIDPPATMSPLFATIWQALASERKSLAIGLLLVTITVTFMVGLPLYYRYLLDEAVIKSDMALLSTMLIGLAIAYLVNSGAALLQAKVFANLSAKISRQLRRQMFITLQSRCDTECDSAAMANHFSADLAAVEKYLAQPIRVMLIHASVLLMSALLLFVIEWRLALFTYTIIPIIMVAMKLLSKPTNRYADKKKGCDAKIAAFVSEEVRTATMLHLFGLKRQRQQQFQQQSDSMHQYEQLSAFWSATTGEISIILVNLIQIGIFGLGAWFAISGYITIGILIAYAGLMINISNAGITLSQLAPQLFDAASAHQRIRQLLQAQLPQSTHSGGGKRLDQIETITLTQVGFGYLPQQTILKQINLTLRQGEHVAIVGSSGSGKSTLLKLMMGLESCREGQICYNQIPIEQLDLATLHQRMATVFQQPLLLNTTLSDNIRCGKLDATEQQIEQAAREAGIAATIEQMAQGYQSVVGESGGSLSGGQQQRIAIARALIRQPQVLILDEATSALDATTEQAFIEMLQQHSHNRTVIAVTHRLSLATAMDRIVVLDQGEIVEDGSHSELLQHNGLYALLWQKQAVAHSSADT
ncbi:ABC transporter ATP-binding protein [Ectothiorhodospiraceae bacterium BW-2]|nr:ABC transporter ATP-binding protein [Ectothiorhodospiraceae bacterium BW-2]